MVFGNKVKIVVEGHLPLFLNRYPHTDRFFADREVAMSTLINGDNLSDIPGSIKKFLPCMRGSDIHAFACCIPGGNYTGKTGLAISGIAFACKADTTGIVKIIMLRTVSM